MEILSVIVIDGEILSVIVIDVGLCLPFPCKPSESTSCTSTGL